MTSTERNPGLSPAVAAAVVGSILVLNGTISRRYSPDPSHPGLRRWYKALDKPSVTPPDAVFGAAWPLLLSGLGAGAYRLLRRPASPARTAGLVLAGATLGLVTGYAKLAFGDRDLTAGTVESEVLVGVGAAYVATAALTDRRAAAYGLPLVLWSSFGSWLTAQLRDRNPRLDSGADS